MIVMEIIGPLILSFIAGISTLLGCVFIFIKTKRVEEFITFSLSFSFIIILSISIFDLLPGSLYKLYINYNGILGLFLALFVFILGNISIRVINNKIKDENSTNLYRVGILSMLSLMMHNIPEGIAVFISSYSNINVGIKICIAIMLHNIPEGILISVPLYHSGVRKKKVILYTFLSGIAEPIGGLLGFLLLRNILNDVTLSFVLIFVAGLMINLAVKDILVECIKYNKKKYLISGILLGTLFFIITLII
jgi:ZIP family zinc transporter